MSRAESPLRDRMIFCVGAQRSGTTWLQRMLAVHPDVVTLPSETQLISVGIATLARQTHQGALSSKVTGRTFMEADAFADAARDFCDAVYGGLATTLSGGTQFVLERSPNHAEALDLVGALYPDARVAHIIRDGRDVARSIVAQRWGPGDIAGAARRWRRAVQTARQAGAAFAVYTEVRYEDLLADTRERYTTLLATLGLAAEQTVIDEALAEAARARNVDSSRPRIAQGKWQAVWSPDDLAAFEAEAGDLLYDELGYARLPATAQPRSTRTRVRVGAVRALSRLRSYESPADESAALGSVLRNDTPNPVRVCDDFVSAFATAKVDRLTRALSTDVVVRVFRSGEVTEMRGEAGARLLEETARTDGEWGRQVRGDVFAGTPTVTMVLQHERAGTTTDRVVAVQSKGWAITHVDYYRLGDATAAPQHA